jgi:hypothetical protein
LSASQKKLQKPTLRKTECPKTANFKFFGYVWWM